MTLVANWNAGRTPSWPRTVGDGPAAGAMRSRATSGPYSPCLRSDCPPKPASRPDRAPQGSTARSRVGVVALGPSCSWRPRPLPGHIARLLLEVREEVSQRILQIRALSVEVAEQFPLRVPPRALLPGSDRVEGCPVA